LKIVFVDLSVRNYVVLGDFLFEELVLSEKWSSCINFGSTY